MSAAAEEEANPYELLGLAVEATEQEIKKAYRQRSLKVHPDRNPGNPDAARKFHELNQAHELLLDPLRRMALDAKLRIKEARTLRYASYDAKRKGLVEELEERERALKKARVDTEIEKKERWRENERIMEQGRRLREERELEMQRKAREREELEHKVDQSNDAAMEPPSLGQLDTTVRIKYLLASHLTLTDTPSLAALLTPFGSLDDSSIVLSLKPPPPKKPKRVIALVPFKEIGGAFAAVCSSGRAEIGMKDMEVDWAEGKEPELIEWLKKMGQLASPQEHSHSSDPTEGTARPAPSSDSSFSSFPATFPDLSATSHLPQAVSAASGLDYESLTLMRMRQAERARLEREIQEREALEGD